jgi:hypothetical protein
MIEVSVFISYSHHDQATALALDQWLRNKGARVFLDQRDFIPGNDLESEIVRCIKQAGKVVCIYSKNSSNRPYIEFERRLSTALERQSLDNRKRLIYFVIDKTPLPDEAAGRLHVLAGSSFQDALLELWKGITDTAGEPKEIDLTQYEVTPPWLQETIQYGRTSDDITALYKEFQSKELSGLDRVTHIQWIAEGPVKEALQLLELIASGEFSMAEKDAARFAMNDIREGKKSKNLIDRVTEKGKKTFPSQEGNGESAGGLAALGVATTMFYWERPGTKTYTTILGIIEDAAFGNPDRTK